MKPEHPTIRAGAIVVAAALAALGPGVPSGAAQTASTAVSGPAGAAETVAVPPRTDGWIGPARIVKRKRIAPGVTYTKIVQKRIPRRTFVLELDLSKAITLDTTIADAALPSRRPLSRIVRSAGALAAVNGDYGGSGDPVHPFAQDGHLLQTTDNLGSLFAVTRDETQTFFGKVRVDVTVMNRTTGQVLTLDRWNDGDPVPGELVGYSPLGGTLEEPPPYACSARLVPKGPPTAADPDGIERSYTVDAVQCSATPLDRAGGVVLSAAPATDEATQLLAIEPGTTMRLHWTFGWPNVFDAVGGAPMLVEDGRLVGICGSSCGRNPRTGVGVTQTGTILLVVVDGRRARWSIGASMFEFARIMQDLGAVTALNLDGGGSSEMVVEGEIVNRPSDGRERHISNAVLVLPGPDPDEP